MNIVQSIIELLGGLGLFFLGMNLMSTSLEKIASGKLKYLLQKLTQNKYIGVLLGTFVTAIIQSSGATTVMLVGFVNSNLMTLEQSIGILMGANIGTTVTAQLISLDLSFITPLVIGISSIGYLLVKNSKRKNIFLILLGFGILFLGMNTMSEAMSPLTSSTIFTNILKTIDNNVFLGIVIGIVITTIMQSSSASTGVLIALASTGSITLSIALPIILGCNIGSCSTTLLSAIGAHKVAKRTALIHLLFNIIGVLITIPFMNLLCSFVQFISPLSIERQIANIHTIFNILTTIILLPFTNMLAKLSTKLIPDAKQIYSSTKSIES